MLEPLASEYNDFTDILRGLMQRECRTNSDLALLTNISVRTIEKWTAGETRRPRFVGDVLKLAQGLALNRCETASLLSAADHPALEQLVLQAEQTQDASLLALLRPWRTPVPADESHSQSFLHQLRPPVADFVGRTHEVTKLVATLHSAKQQYVGCICGIHGMGGIGKTELAARVAHEVVGLFPNGQLLVELYGASQTPLSSSEALRQLIRALAGNNSVPMSSDLAELEQRYRTLLHERRVLIVANDVRDAEHVRPLIPPVGSALLLTSRQRFSLPGMVSLHLEPLGDESYDLLQRICQRLGHGEAQVIAQACAGLPLALRVSAGLLQNNPALRIGQYMARVADIRQRLRHLCDPDDPQHDVAASLFLSYDLLNSQAQQVLRQLGVLVADFDAALAATTTGMPLSAVEPVLHLLLRRNLLSYDLERERWICHDLVRAMALEQLAQAGEEDAVCWRYAVSACQIAEEAQTMYRHGSGDETIAALQRFDQERPHIDAAWRWALNHTGSNAGDRLLVNLAQASEAIGRLRYHEGDDILPRLDVAVAAAQRLGDLAQIYETQCLLAATYEALGAPQKGIALLEHVLPGVQAFGNQALEAKTLRTISNNLLRIGGRTNLERALDYQKQALILFRAQNNDRDACITLNNIGLAHLCLLNFVEATATCEEALTLARRLGHCEQQAMILNNLGKIHTQINQHEQAIIVYHQALALARQIQYQRGVGIILACLGDSYAAIGESERAITTYEEALILLQAQGDQHNTAWCTWDLGRMLVQIGQHRHGLELMHRALDYNQRIGHAEAAADARELARIEADIAMLTANA